MVGSTGSHRQGSTGSPDDPLEEPPHKRPQVQSTPGNERVASAAAPHSIPSPHLCIGSGRDGTR